MCIRSLVSVGFLTLGFAACAENSAVTPAPAAPEAVSPVPPPTGENPPPAMSAPPTLPTAAASLPPAPPLPATPTGLPDLPVSVDNPLTAEKAAIGKQLFFDKRLSKDGSMSCSSCHVHEKGWTDGISLATKVGGVKNTRTSPTMYNLGYHAAWYWDGRATTLEKNIEAAWKSQLGGDPTEVAIRLGAIPEYKSQCERICGKAPTGQDLINALASYVRTLRSGDSPWDRYEAGDKTAVSADVVAGYKVFTEKAKCSLCHAPPFYTDLLFHNVGVGIDSKEPDVGRGKISGKPEDTGAFKTPTLRSVTKTAPYFHDGHEASLEDAMRFMVKGGKRNPHLDPKLKPAKLSAKEFAQLLAFVRSLESTEGFEPPKIP